MMQEQGYEDAGGMRTVTKWIFGLLFLYLGVSTMLWYAGGVQPTGLHANMIARKRLRAEREAARRN